MNQVLHGENKIYPFFCLITSTLVFFLGLLLVKQNVFPLFLGAIILLNILFGYGKTMLYVLPIFTFFGMITGIFSLIGGNQIQALQSASRVFLLGLSTIPTISMSAIDLMRCLNAINCPRWLTLGLLISIRFVAVMKKEISQIILAMKLRGINSKWYNPKIWYRAIIIPLVVRVLSISDILTISLETRAFSMTEPATQYKKIKIHLFDSLYLIGICVVIFGSLLSTTFF